MKINLRKTVTAVGLMAASATCLAFTPLNGGQTDGRDVYVSDVELCNNGTILIRLSFSPEEICTGANPAICNSIAPAWFYVDPNDTTGDSYQRLVNAASVAEANQFQLNYFSSTQSVVALSCNNQSVTTAGEITVLEVSNHG